MNKQRDDLFAALAATSQQDRIGLWRGIGFGLLFSFFFAVAVFGGLWL